MPEMTWGCFYWLGDGKTYGRDSDRRDNPEVPPLESHLWWKKSPKLRQMVSGSPQEIAEWMARQFAGIEHRLGGTYALNTPEAVQAFALQELESGNSLTFTYWLKDRATLMCMCAVREQPRA